MADNRPAGIAREIGGYLELERLVSREYYPDLLAVNTARHALVYLIRARNIRKLYLPSFLCDCVEEACRANGVELVYYAIGRDFRPVFPAEAGKDAFVYVVNYYGQIGSEEIAAFKARYPNLIVDNVQAFFQRPVDGVDTVYSCRKFFGVPDGGYLATTAPALPLEADRSAGRMTHVLGRFEGCASDWYGRFQESDESLRQEDLKAMSAMTRNLLGAVDYESVRQRREENYAVLARRLGARNGLKLQTPVGPYCYPFHCENGMAVKRALAAQKIYVPTLWPNVLDSGSASEKDYAENILPLPCDQRYSPADMEFLADALDAQLGK